MNQENTGSRARDRAGSGLRWPDYVLRAAMLVIVGVFLVRSLVGDHDGDGTSADSMTSIDASEESNLPALAGNAEDVWNKVELVLRDLGYLHGAGPATLAEIRSGLKSYQHAIGARENGVLSQEMLNRILDENVTLGPYLVPRAIVEERWFFEQDKDGCSISTGATRIEGRTVATQRPVLAFGRSRKTRDANEIDVSLGKSDLFEKSAPVTFTAHYYHEVLQVRGTDIGMGLEPDGKRSSQVPRKLSRGAGEVQISGTSAYGGTLRLSFSTDGFEGAYRAVAAECGAGVLHWIDD